MATCSSGGTAAAVARRSRLRTTRPRRLKLHEVMSMKQVAVIAVLGAIAVVAATGLVQGGRERAALFEQSRVQHDELTRRLDRLERLVSASLDTAEARRAAASQGPAVSSAKTQEAAGQQREKSGSLA